VLLAPLGRPPPVAMLDEARRLGTLPEKLAALKETSDKLMAGKLAPSDNYFGEQVSYFTELDARGEIAIARMLGKPILILRGADDYQVVGGDIANWRGGLAGIPNVKIETIPGLYHLFLRSNGCRLSECYGQPGHVDVQVILTVADFIRNLRDERTEEQPLDRLDLFANPFSQCSRFAISRAHDN
jgi:hypothetical protein